MRRTLIPHPDLLSVAASRIQAEAERPTPAALILRYRLDGDVESLILPPAAAPERTDGLWRHTVFEAFLRAPGHDAYFEFNFSPSTAWAAYRFSGYREGLTEAPLDAAPLIDARVKGIRYEMAVSLDLHALPELTQAPEWQIGLSAVIEAVGGSKSYWALAHPPGKPDFHHADGFVLHLA